MAVLDLAQLTWEEVRDLDRAKAVAILPVGAVEAHGPHLPLATDVIIAETMARAAAARLATHGYDAVLLPPLAYTAAEFAAGFPGTVSLRPGTVTALLLDLARSLTRHGLHVLAVANAHLDPAHVAALEAAVAQNQRENGTRIVFPDVTKRPWALRLTEEFRSGACHAGRVGRRRGGPHPDRDRGVRDGAARRRTPGLGRAGRRDGPGHRVSPRARSRDAARACGHPREQRRGRSLGTTR